MAQPKKRPELPVLADIENDLAAWSHQQAELLRRGLFGQADLPNSIEELESMGREQRHALASSYWLL